MTIKIETKRLSEDNIINLCEIANEFRCDLKVYDIMSLHNYDVYVKFDFKTDKSTGISSSFRCVLNSKNFYNRIEKSYHNMRKYKQFLDSL